MPSAAPSISRARRLVLVAMIFAVAMMFIDQTIVVLAVPDLEKDLSLSSNGAQWIVNGYLLSLSALFALGGKLADVLGHRRMVMVGVTSFAVFSALCGATPTGQYAEAWIVVCRVLQGASAAVLFPAALAIVVAAFPVRERGRALAVFFGVTGALTAVGPIAGGYLTEWTWRSIFWINVPVAIVALVLTRQAKPAQERQDVPIDFGGAVLISGGMGLVVLALQQASLWGWTDERTLGCVGGGLVLLLLFALVELRRRHPLIQLRVFRDRAFAVDCGVLLLMSAVFVPIFFFSSIYAQASLGYSAQEAGKLILVFFAGFAIAAQYGGRILDARGAKPAVVLGCGLAAVGLALWARTLPGLDFGGQWPLLGLAGAGLGLVLGPVSTDALNRAPGAGYGEITGVTQTVRNFGASLGMAVMGSVFVTQNVTRVTDTLTAKGVPSGQAREIAHTIASGGGGAAARSGGQATRSIVEAVQLDLAHSTQVVVYVMAGIMAAACVLAQVGLKRGRGEEVEAEPEDRKRLVAAT
jgi:EmrB/QacA subfamily drug resistance transporter